MLNDTFSMRNSETLFVSRPIDESTVTSITGLVIGITFGSVVFVFGICLFVILIRRRMSRSRQTNTFAFVGDDNDEVIRGGIIAHTFLDLSDVAVGKTRAMFDDECETSTL
jgi:hypothetical protein